MPKARTASRNPADLMVRFAYGDRTRFDRGRSTSVFACETLTESALGHLAAPPKTIVTPMSVATPKMGPRSERAAFGNGAPHRGKPDYGDPSYVARNSRARLLAGQAATR
jgi:hypothetical protein